MVVWGALDRACFSAKALLWVCFVTLSMSGGVSAQTGGQPDLEVTYSYWLDGQKAADLTVAFSILRVSDEGLETIVIDQTYWTHGLPGVPTGRTKATSIAHYHADGTVSTLAYTLDFSDVGGGQISVQRVGDRLRATGFELPIDALPEEMRERAEKAMDPYSAAISTMFRLQSGACPNGGDVLLPEGLITLDVRRLGRSKCRVRERAIALVEGASFTPAESFMEMAQVEDFWLPISGTYTKGDAELAIWLEGVVRAGEEINQIALR